MSISLFYGKSGRTMMGIGKKIVDANNFSIMDDLSNIDTDVLGVLYERVLEDETVSVSKIREIEQEIEKRS